MTSVVLTCGAAKVDVSCEGGLKDLARKAEAEFGLCPESFDLCDAYGPIEGSTLSRALQVSPCIVQVQERPVWRRIREIDEKIGAALDPGSMAQEIEDRIMAKVNEAVAQLRKDVGSTDAKVEQALAPVVKSVALAQMDFMREARSKLDSLESSLDALPTALLKEAETRAESSLEELRAAMNEDCQGLSAKVTALSQEVAGMQTKSAMSEDLCSLGTPTQGTPLRRLNSRGTILGQIRSSPLGIAPSWETTDSKKLSFGGSKTALFAEAEPCETADFFTPTKNGSASLRSGQLHSSRSATFLPRVC